MKMNNAQRRAPLYPKNGAAKSPLRPTSMYCRPSDGPQRMTIKPGQSLRSTQKSKMPAPTTASGIQRPAPQDVRKQRKVNHKVTSLKEGSCLQRSHPKVPVNSYFESVASYMATHCPNVKVSFIEHIEGISMHEVIQTLNLTNQTTSRFPQSKGIQECRLSSSREVTPTSGLSLTSRATSNDYEVESQSKREYKETMNKQNGKQKKRDSYKH